MMAIASLLIVEDLPEARSRLSAIATTAFADVQVHAVCNVKQARRAIDEKPWQMALVDLGLPDGSGLEVIRYAKKKQPDLMCVVSTVVGEDSQIVAALSAGAQGFLLKGQPGAQIAKQLRQLQDGIPALSPAIALRIMQHFQRTGPIVSSSEKLSAREAEVLKLIAKGLRNSDVAIALGLADTTIATHIKSIYRKLGISSRAEAALHATRLGLT
ncbi:LuxR C-terminal-related transcriptional regulator [Maritalea sp.]|uniref:LuxR C-terminal-related transcriptional regulator n=1 Tax=Maritalea sp. TaxID=2003361 RepID=UPI003EF952BA